MALLNFYDSAYPPSPQPKGMDGVCGYIGGDTPHTWSVADWDSQKVKYRLPVYVRSNPPGPGAMTDVDAAVAQLKIIGAPHGTLVAWDMETAADASYITAVYEGLKAAGYTLIVYGSQSSVLGNKNPDGLYWGADWTNVPHLAVDNQVTQWASFNAYDVDVAEATLPFWNTSPPTPPNPYPLLKDGSTGSAVVTLQLRLNVWGAKLTTDGVFGPLTLAALKAFQTAHKLPVTGETDVTTWKDLLASPPPPPPAELTYGPPLNLKARAGRTSVALSWSPPGTPGLPLPAEYRVFVYEGTVCNVHTSVPSYPRVLGAVLSYQGGSLKKGLQYTAHIVASGPDGTHIRADGYASVTFTTG
jgi:peptidoglycan hydrolase-like protein with peptidoglycan-binding domain